jgi:hypothetical protein
MMPTLTQPAQSSQPVEQQVIPPSGVTPTSDPVFLAFVAMPTYGSPTMPASTSSAWNAASWITDSSGNYWASVMVGPNNGGVVLATGSYAIAVKVVDPAATPCIWGWSLIVT